MDSTRSDTPTPSEGATAGTPTPERGSAGAGTEPEGRSDAANPAEPLPGWAIGAAVSLRRIPRYLKTADPMPMLRPPDLVDVEEVGVVVAQRALGLLAVRFRRGTFLMDAEELQAAESTG